MWKLAVVNQKGGTGKTATAVNLAAALAESGKRVLLIDLDAQCSATDYLGVAPAGQGALELFSSDTALKEFVIKTEFKGLDVVPASEWYHNISKVMTDAGAELALREKLLAMPADYDYVFIDCPPQLGYLTIAALAAVEGLVVPVETAHQAVAGLAQLMKTYQVVRKRLNPELAIVGVLPCRFIKAQKSANEVIANLRNTFGDLVFDTPIRQNVKLSVAPSYRKPVTVYEPSSNGALDYKAVAKELQARNKRRAK